MELFALALGTLLLVLVDEEKIGIWGTNTRCTHEITCCLPVDMKSDVRTEDGLRAQNVDDVAVCDAGPMLLFSVRSKFASPKSVGSVALFEVDFVTAAIAHASAVCPRTTGTTPSPKMAAAWREFHPPAQT